MVRRLADRIHTRSLVRVLAAPLPLLDLVTPGYVPISAGATQPLTAVSEAPVVETPIVVMQRDEAVKVIIASGDNMWTLAESRLHEVLGRPPADAETGPYWRRVVQVNRDRIRSGDPDLIFPGEVLILPPV
jgi:nucleoid-associated protein YgaU